MISFAQKDINRQGEYIKLLTAIAQLSGLFSEDCVP